MNNDLIDYDFQLSLIERSKDNMTFDKNDSQKIEIAFDFIKFDANKNEYDKSLIKMNFAEFQEIFEEFKKIDKQLHLFKN